MSSAIATRRGARVALALLASSGLTACSDPLTVEPEAYAFTHVTVVPMDQERVLPDHTVLVRDGRIDWLGPSEEAVIDADVVVIDGRGAWLMPGLADMHVHTWDEEDQLLFVAYGVTTVRNMWGTDVQLSFRDRIRSGELLGPTIITAGPIMDGDPPAWEGSQVLVTPDAARQAVRDLADRGFDFAKPYNGLEPHVYQAILEEAGRLGVPVAGHVPRAVGLRAVIDGAQASIEHLNRYSTLLQSDPPGEEDALLGEGGWLTADPGLMPGLGRLLAEGEMWSVPTLVLWDGIAFTEAERQAFLARPEVAWVSPNLRRRWTERAFSPGYVTLVRDGQPARLAMVAALRDAGAPILAGTDVGNPFIIPGVSLHAELSRMVEAGLTPYEALAAATRDAAEFFGQPGEFGTIRPGARADLILVAGNPLLDVANANRRVGVMARGRWLTEGELRERLGRQAGG